MKKEICEKPVVIVTGAAHGIGKAVASRLAKDGWQVVVADLDGDALKSLCEAIDAEPVIADVSLEWDLRRLVATALKSFGRLDAIVSNAGISEFKSLADSSIDDWNRVIATNLTPAFVLAKEAETTLRAAKGSMVLIASTRAHQSEPDTHAYAATKGGLVALTHSLAISLGPDVRVNCISPGWIDVSGDPLSEKDHRQHPAGRVGKPDDIASAVAYLLSSEAGFITGAEWIIDGGMTRKMIYH